MSSKNDQVFPVSLSEIAFILVFLLMLLLGFMIIQEQKGKETAQAKLAKARQVEDAAAVTQEMRTATQNLTQALQNGGVVNPAEVIQAVAEAGKANAERELLRQEVIDLTKKLVALEELRVIVEQAGKEKNENVVREQVEQAIVLWNEIERLVENDFSRGESGKTGQSDPKKQAERAVERVRQAIEATDVLQKEARERLKIEVKAGEEPAVIRQVVETAQSAAQNASEKQIGKQIKDENNKLRTQVAFYERRDKLRGLDHPPCWMDKNSKIEYIFNVHTTPEGMVVTPGWPPHREDDAKSSQGFDTLMSASGAPMSIQQFAAGAKPFLDYGKKQAPECRHFVFLSSSITDADRRDVTRRQVNSFFYVLERKAQPLKVR